MYEINFTYILNMSYLFNKLMIYLFWSPMKTITFFECLVGVVYFYHGSNECHIHIVYNYAKTWEYVCIL